MVKKLPPGKNGEGTESEEVQPDNVINLSLIRERLALESKKLVKREEDRSAYLFGEVEKLHTLCIGFLGVINTLFGIIERQNLLLAECAIDPAHIEEIVRLAQLMIAQCEVLDALVDSL